MEASGNFNKWFLQQGRREELAAPRPGGQGQAEEGLMSLHLVSLQQRKSMELERIVSAALLAFVSAHLPEADLR